MGEAEGRKHRVAAVVVVHVGIVNPGMYRMEIVPGIPGMSGVDGEGGGGRLDGHHGGRGPEDCGGGKVARWQNVIPSFPWIAPGLEGGSAIQGKEGIKFCSVV